MNKVLTTLAITSTLILVACNKTKKVTTTHTSEPTSEIDVDVKFDGHQIVLKSSSEERIIDLSDLLGGIDLDSFGGEMKIEVMVIGNEGTENGQWLVQLDDFEGNHEIHMIVNGEEVDGLPEGMMEHIMGMMGPKGGHGGMEEMREHIMRMMGGDEPHEEMRVHIMGMMGPEGDHGGMEEMRGRMMQIRSNPRGDDMRGEWRQHERERGSSEEHQFMEELNVFEAVADHLNLGEAVSLLGIHMIRDELEGELRLEALETIIEEAALGSAARNAAIIVAIRTHQEEGNEEEAADLMVELVLSN